MLYCCTLGGLTILSLFCKSWNDKETMEDFVQQQTREIEYLQLVYKPELSSMFSCFALHALNQTKKHMVSYIIE